MLTQPESRKIEDRLPEDLPIRDHHDDVGGDRAEEVERRRIRRGAPVARRAGRGRARAS